MRCVSHVRETLEDLTISVGHVGLDQGHHYNTAVTQGSMRELAGFSQLRSLEVPLLILTLSFTPHDLQPIKQSLPPGLECLTIADIVSFGPEWDDSPESPFYPVEEWLERCKATTPRMRRVRFLSGETVREDRGATLADNDDEALSARFGLHFKVVKTSVILNERRY